MIVSFYSALNLAWYCSTLTFSIPSTALPSGRSWIAMCVIAVVGVAPCQCFTPAGICTTSPLWISSTAPLQLCTRPVPAVTTRVCPNGWVCHTVRAFGSKVTSPPEARSDAFTPNGGSMRTELMKRSAVPF